VISSASEQATRDVFDWQVLAVGIGDRRGEPLVEEELPRSESYSDLSI